MKAYDKGAEFLQWSLLLGTILAAAVFLSSGCEKEQKHGSSPPLPTVEVVEVIQKDIPIHSEWVATTDGFVNATIRAQVQGYLIKQTYREGDFVKKGQMLFEIDPRPFQAAVDQAKASRDQAQAARDQARASLEQAKATVDQAKADVARTEARYVTAKINLERVRPLAARKALSQKDLDDAVGNEQSAQASVVAAQATVGAAQASVNAAQSAIGAAEAAILAAQAMLDKAELELSFTKILSPINGIAGIAKAQIGNLVGPGQMEELTTISTIDPIKVYISVSEQAYLKAMGLHKAVRNVPLELILADGSTFPHKGELFLADRQVDVKTGTIRVGAIFANPGFVLRPGQFARVRAVTHVIKDGLLVPQRAVTELQGNYQVAVVGPDNKVDIRPVKPAERVQNLWVIEEGLKPGERVVAMGVQKVRQGLTVNAKPFAPPSKEAPAKPEAKTDPAVKTEKR